MPVSDRQAMIRGMAPLRRPGVWIFCTTNQADLAANTLADALATFAEEEGISLILPEATARDLGFPVDNPQACLTLSVHSALDGVGLTAAVVGVLADHGISCNMVAAFHHDHVFVPVDQADRAIALLIARAAQA